MATNAIAIVVAGTAGAAAVLWWAARWIATRKPRVLETSQIHLYRVVDGPMERHVGIFTGDLRRARCAEVWVNPENTDMRMARTDEFSVSAIIRYEGARRDAAGRVITDLIADQLDRRVGARRPVPAGTAIITGAGELTRFGVRHVAHVAAVQGEPGSGFRQVREIGRCVTAVLAAIDLIAEPPPVCSVLFPLLGTGQGGGHPTPTAQAMIGAVVDYFAATPASPVTVVYLLAYTDTELAACRAACDRHALRTIPPSSARRIARTARPVLTSATPAPRPAPAPKTLHLGFALDIVGFGSRDAPAQETIERRLVVLLRRMLTDAGTDLDQVDHQWHGDGASVYLPTDVDPAQILTDLMGAVRRRLAVDNQHAERIRLRMAVTVGLLGAGATGYTGPLVVDLARMLEAPPLRQALADNPERDLAVLLSDHLYDHVIRPGYLELPTASLRRIDVTVKEFAAQAWLWVPRQ